MHLSNVTAVILAGGKGRRMGGVDKGLIEFNGQALIKPIIAALAPQVEQLIINANRNLESYRELGYPVISDADNNFFGPLAGFLAAMKAADNDELFLAPCDGPLLKGELMQRLISARRNSSSDIAVAHDGNRLQPVYVSLLTNLKTSLEAYLHSGERKIDHWYQQHSVIQVDCSDIKDCFVNINTLDERNQLETRQ